MIWIRCLPTVYLSMCLQVTKFRETLFTLLTCIRLLPTVYLDMYIQFTIVCDSSHIVDKHKTFLHCDLDMYLQFTRFYETLLTSIRLLPTVYPDMCLQLTLMMSIMYLPTVYPGTCLQFTRLCETLLTLFFPLCIQACVFRLPDLDKLFSHC